MDAVNATTRVASAEQARPLDTEAATSPSSPPSGLRAFLRRFLSSRSGATTGASIPSITTPPEPTSAPLPRADQPLLRLKISLWDHGYERAVASGATEVREEDVAPLQALARAMARETGCAKYDPKKNPDDGLREREYEKVIQDRAALEDRLRHAEAGLRDADQALSAMPPAGAEPEVPGWGVAAATAAIVGSLLPTFHDLLLGIDDAILPWVIALVFSLSIALTLVSLIARSLGSSAARETAGLIGGIVVGIGALATRLACTSGASEAVASIGLSAIEIGVVVLVHAVTNSLRPRYAEWRERGDHLATAEKTRTSCALACDRIRADIAICDQAVQKHLALVTERTLRNLSVADIEEAAVQAVCDGYAAGVAANRGRLRGVQRRVK